MIYCISAPCSASCQANALTTVLARSGSEVGQANALTVRKGLICGNNAPLAGRVIQIHTGVIAHIETGRNKYASDMAIFISDLSGQCSDHSSRVRILFSTVYRVLLFLTYIVVGMLLKMI
eukprot:sb/3476222/